MKKNTMLLLALASVLLGVLWYSGFDFGALTTTSSYSGISSQSLIMIQDNSGQGGYWWRTNGYTTSGNKMTVNGSALQFDINPPQAITDGDKVITPKDGIKILYTSQPLTCKYLRGDEASGMTGTSSTIATIVGASKVYMVKEVSNNMWADFSVYKTGTSNTWIGNYTMNLANVGSSEKIYEDKDGKGRMILDAGGMNTGMYSCPSSTTGYRILERQGKLTLVDMNELNAKLNKLLICAPIMVSGGIIADALKAECNQAIAWYTNPTPAQGLVGTFTYNTADGYVIQSIKDAGRGEFSITADADFFNAGIEIAPDEADPEILSLGDCSKIPENGETLLTVEVRNNGGENNIQVIPTMDYAEFSPQVSSDVIAQGDKATFNFDILGGDIRSDLDKKDATLTVKACSGTNCDTKTTTCTVINEKNVSEGVCGDCKCTGLEGITCASDCDPKCGVVPPKTCNGAFMYTDEDGVCRCTEPYDYTLVSGEWKCIQPKGDDNTLLYVAGGVVLLMVIAGGAFYLTSPKGKAKKRG